MGKHCSNKKYIKKKNYKAKFLTISILKNKFNKDNFRKTKPYEKTLQQSINYVKTVASTMFQRKKL